MKSLYPILAAATIALGAVPAHATDLLFTLSGSRSASFSLDTDATPAFYTMSALIGDQVGYDSVAGIYNGVAETASVSFGTNLIASLNITADGLGFTQFAGPELFSTVGSKPVFHLGTFPLTSFVSGASTLTIAEAGVPEPATWATMLAGLALAGGAVRRSRKAHAGIAHA